MNKYRHFLLTKFNLHIAHTIGDSNLRGPWLDHRFEIFDRFCYPSVANQTCRNFNWLVLFDSKTDDKYHSKIDSYKEFTPLYVKGIKNIGSLIKEQVKDLPDYLITSRLDNDDCLGQHYIGKVQQQFDNQNFEFINFYDGCQYHSGHSHAYVHDRNMFISLIEKYNDFKTVWCCTHGAIYETGPVRQIKTPYPMWMVVIHEKNALNRIATRKQINIDLKKEFGII